MLLSPGNRAGVPLSSAQWGVTCRVCNHQIRNSVRRVRDEKRTYLGPLRAAWCDFSG